MDTQLLIERLRARYPDAACALVHQNPFQLLVATILSAQCTDVRVNIVTPGLFARFPDPTAMSRATQDELEGIIRSTGFYRSKTKAIRAASQRIVDAYGGVVPQTMEALLTLPGVARKTASVVLGVGYNVAEGVVVDTHVWRVSRRLGLSRGKNPDEIERDLMRVVPRESWIDFAHLLIFHGRQICQARKPKCQECPVQDLCPSARYFLNGKVPPWERKRAEARAARKARVAKAVKPAAKRTAKSATPAKRAAKRTARRTTKRTTKRAPARSAGKRRAG